MAGKAGYRLRSPDILSMLVKASAMHVLGALLGQERLVMIPSIHMGHLMASQPFTVPAHGSGKSPRPCGSHIP